MTQDSRTQRVPPDLTWSKSSTSGNDGGNCVEVAWNGPAVLVRDSVDRRGGTLRVPLSGWADFTRLIRVES